MNYWADFFLYYVPFFSIMAIIGFLSSDIPGRLTISLRYTGELRIYMKIYGIAGCGSYLSLRFTSSL